MLFTFVRHGETDYNKQLIIQGRKDIPLNNFGRNQAKLTAQAIRNHPYDLIISSPLVRAFETAQIIAREINYTKDIEINQSFIERNFGIADGKLVKEYIDLVHEDTIEGLETEIEIKERVLNGLKIYTQFQNVLIITHSHTIKAILAAIDPIHYDFMTRLDNASVNVVEYLSHQFKIIKVNGTTL